MNANAYRTPGLYFEASDARSTSLAATRVDVAAFVGIAARGPLHRPVRVESWAEYTRAFGGFLDGAYLPMAVDGFFANGGLTCWVVRVADPGLARAGGLVLLDRPGARGARSSGSMPAPAPGSAPTTRSPASPTPARGRATSA